MVCAQVDLHVYTPVVQYKAAAEVSKNRMPIGEVGGCGSRMAERIH